MASLAILVVVLQSKQIHPVNGMTKLTATRLMANVANTSKIGTHLENDYLDTYCQNKNNKKIVKK